MDVVVQIFTQEQREHYNLDGYYSMAEVSGNIFQVHNNAVMLSLADSLPYLLISAKYYLTEVRDIITTWPY